MEKQNIDLSTEFVEQSFDLGMIPILPTKDKQNNEKRGAHRKYYFHDPNGNLL